MPTRNISLTDEQDALVEKVVKAGEYQNASEAVRDALRVLQQRRREDRLLPHQMSDQPGEILVDHHDDGLSGTDRQFQRFHQRRG